MATKSSDVQNALIASWGSQGKGEDQGVVSELTAIVDQLRKDFKTRDDTCHRVDDILFRRGNVDIPAAYKKTALQVRSPLAQRIANLITAALSVNPPTVQFQPTGFGQSYQENSTEREHFFDASWKRQEEEAKRRLFRIFMYSLVTKGEGTLKTVERTKTAWGDYTKYSQKLTDEMASPDGPYQGMDQSTKDRTYNTKTEEYKRGQPYPIRTVFVPADTFYFIKGDDGFTLAAEVKDVPYYEGLERFGYSLNEKGNVVPQGMGLPRAGWSQVMGKSTTLTLLEVWDWQNVNYILVGKGQGSSSRSLGKGTLVRKLAHGYGDESCKTLRGPYFHSYGITTDSGEAEEAGLSVLYPYLDLFPVLDSMLTIRANAAYFTGFPSWKYKMAPGAAIPPNPYGNDGSETDGTTTDIVPGKIYPYDIEPIQMPAAGPEFAAMFQELRMMLADALPAVVQGAAPGDSGYQDNLATWNARLGWDPIVKNAEIAMAERTGFESWLIENKVGEPVTVWGEAPPDLKKKGSRGGWLTMDGKTLGGVHRYQIALNPETPSNRIIEVRTHAELLNLELESWEDAVTAMGNNPDEVEQSNLLRKLKNDPQVFQTLRDRMFHNLSTMDQKALTPTQVSSTITLGPGQQRETTGSQALPGAPVPDVTQPGQQGVPLVPPGNVGGAPSGVAATVPMLGQTGG